MIKMKEITKTYLSGEQRQVVLDKFDMNIAKGEMVAIMGSSGSGKTTLLNIAGLLDGAETGEYVLNGDDVLHLTDGQKARIRNKEIGFVFQNFHLIQELTALENVRMPLQIANLYTKKKLSKRKMNNLAAEMLEKVGLKNEMGKKPSQLSGGQKQRVAIARALVNKPDIILADEPTGALDNKTTEEILNLFIELNKEGHTLVIITHDPQVAAKCGRTIQINHC